MKSKMTRFSILLLLLGAALNAQSMAGTTAAFFLGIEVGGRPLGMGGAHVASVNDATALYWNPGAAATLPRNEALFVHSNWIADTQFDYVATTFRLGGMAVMGISATVLDYGDMINTTVDEPDGTGLLFSARDLALGITLARAMTDKFSIGGSVKYISQQIWHESANAVAVDVGTLYQTGVRGFTIGMSISNFGTPMRMEGEDLDHFYDIAPELFGNNSKVVSSLKTDDFNLPLLFRAGIKLDAFEAGPSRLTLAVDALHPNNNWESVNAGAEFAFLEKFFLRAGRKALFLENTEEGMTLGLGVKVPMRGFHVNADYAYEHFGRLNDVQNFSLAIGF